MLNGRKRPKSGYLRPAGRLTGGLSRATSAAPASCDRGAPVTRPYAVLDVFSDTPLAGNPLAVVLDAAGLDDAGMQAIAREFNLSETVFVLPAEKPVASARLRIFTPSRELPFAGHPTIGSAVLLALRKAAEGAPGNEMMVMLEETVGAIRCGVFIKSDKAGHAIFDAPLLPTPVPADFDRDAVASALGLLPAEVGFENHRPSAWSAGVPFVFVPVAGLEAIGNAKPNLAAWAGAFGSPQAAAWLYCRESEGSDHDFHARMFAPAFGFHEDPATGSAAAAFAGAVRRFDGPPSGSHRYVIEQGFEIGRPSLMTLEIDVAGGELTAVRVGGNAVVVAEGELAV